MKELAKDFAAISALAVGIAAGVFGVAYAVIVVCEHWLPN